MSTSNNPSLPGQLSTTLFSKLSWSLISSLPTLPPFSFQFLLPVPLNLQDLILNGQQIPVEQVADKIEGATLPLKEETLKVVGALT